jgi:hypothetical protein
VGAPDNRRLFALSGNNPDPLIELGDNALRRGRFEKGDMMFAARCEDALPRLPHFLRIGVAWDRDVAEREAETPGLISAKPSPGTAMISSLLTIPSGLSSLTPSKSSPRGLSGHGSQHAMYSSGDKPHTLAAVISDPRPRVPRPSRPEAASRVSPCIRSIGEGRFGSTPAE